MDTVNIQTKTVVFLERTRSADRQPVVCIFDARVWRVLYSNGDVFHAERSYMPLDRNILPAVDISNVPAVKCADVIMAYVDTDGKISNLDGMLMAFEGIGAVVSRERLAQLEHDRLIAWTNLLAAERAQSETTEAEGFTSAQAQAAIDQWKAAQTAYRDAYTAWYIAKYPALAARHAICEEKLLLELAVEDAPDYSGDDDLRNSLEFGL